MRNNTHLAAVGTLETRVGAVTVARCAVALSIA